MYRAGKMSQPISSAYNAPRKATVEIKLHPRVSPAQDQGTTVMRVKNPDAKLDDGKPNFEHDAPLPEAEAAAVALIGPPHNYLGFPDPADARSASPERSGTAGAQASALTVGTAAAGPSGELSTASVGGGAAAGGAPGSPGPRDLTQPASLTLQSRLDYEPAQRDAAVKEQRDANAKLAANLLASRTQTLKVPSRDTSYIAHNLS